MIQNRAGPGRCCPDMKIEEGVCQGCGNKPSTSDVESTSPPLTYYVVIQLKAYRYPDAVHPEDDFSIRAYVDVDKFDAIKEAFLDEITMTMDKVAVEKVRE
jgi:hypothetical protein